MRNRPRRIKLWMLGLVALCALVLSSVAAADPPTRVARLAHINGAVSFSPAGEDEWVQATVNRPLITGDRVWVDAGSRAELQLGTAALRLGPGTSVTIINLDDRVAQFELAQGTVNVRVRSLRPDELVEVDTPQLALTLRRIGEARVDVDAQGVTAIAMLRGEGEAWGESAAFTIAAGQWYRFFDSALRNYESDAIPAPDDFDRWAFDRDRREERAASARYVAPEVIGYADLDDYGSWSSVESYGNVWFPASVPSGWAPYRYGRWAWVEPWGWTWVDDAPWGFAPFHYGRWAFVRERWCWVPGPVRARPVYAPALVAFVGGGNLRVSLSTGAAPGVAWFPLGPGEVYRPSYRVSRSYFTNINVSNTRIDNTYVTNVYNNAGAAQANYQHQRRPNAITAVPATAFAQSRPVAQAAVAVAPGTIANAPATTFAPVAPTRASVVASGAANTRPPAAATQRGIVARTAPPPTIAPFAAREQALARDPGKPLDPSAANSSPPTARPPASTVRVVSPAQTGAPKPPPPINRAGGPVQGGAGQGRPAQTLGAPPGAAPSAPVASPNAPVAPAPATVTRTVPQPANPSGPRPPGIGPQPTPPAATAPAGAPASAPQNPPASAPSRPVPPGAAGEVRRAPGGPGVVEAPAPTPQQARPPEPRREPPAMRPEVAAPPPAQERPRELREEKSTSGSPASVARPPGPPVAAPPQPPPAPEVRRAPPPVAAPPQPQPAPAQEIRRAPPPQVAPPPAGAKSEGREPPRDEGKAKQEEKKQEEKKQEGK